MYDIVLHPLTTLASQNYVASPSHAIIITGASGSGKAWFARHLVSQVLKLDASRPDIYESHAYIRILRPIEGKAIPIESAREVQKFLTLKIPGVTADTIVRAVVIEDAHMLTIESQNALLKTLEEPPSDTIFILTAPSIEAVLPTIQSRVRILAILPPGTQALHAYFTGKGYAASAIDRALLVAGELPGLSHALLSDDQNHPLVAATTHARGILGSKTYQRLLLVDGLSKQKQLSLDILYVMGQMARMALLRAHDAAAIQRWQRVLSASYAATEQLQHNTQTKLVLTNLMLAL